MDKTTVFYYHTVLYGDSADSFNDRNGIWQYRAEHIEFCCEEMEKAYAEDFVTFGSEYGKDCNVNLRKEENDGEELMPIQKCPFCGADVKTVESAKFARKRTKMVVPAKEIITYTLEKINN